MNRFISTVGFLTIHFALTTTSASAQYYGHHDYGHHGHSRELLRHDAHYNQGLNHSGYGYNNHYHAGYHASDHLTYPVRPLTDAYAAPAYDEPVCVDLLARDYYCPNSGHCPQSANGVGQQYATVPSQPQLGEYGDGQSSGFYDRPRSGQVYPAPAHTGHDHGDHSHDGHSHGPVNPSLRSPINPFRTPDHQPMTTPTIPDRNPVQQPPSFIAPSEGQSAPSTTTTNDGPIQIDGLPPSLTNLVYFSVVVA